MCSTKDVDDTILAQACAMLPFLQIHGHVIDLQSLADIPRMLVLMFEILRTESLLEEEKPFKTVEECTQTLQMIIDTLEQILQLPLSHITGHGLVALDRRQLADTLNIFDDLFKALYSQEDFTRNDQLTTQQLISPWFDHEGFCKTSTPISMKASIPTNENFLQKSSDKDIRHQSLYGKIQSLSKYVPTISKQAIIQRSIIERTQAFAADNPEQGSNNLLAKFTKMLTKDKDTEGSIEADNLQEKIKLKCKTSSSDMLKHVVPELSTSPEHSKLTSTERLMTRVTPVNKHVQSAKISSCYRYAPYHVNLNKAHAEYKIQEGTKPLRSSGKGSYPKSVYKNADNISNRSGSKKSFKCQTSSSHNASKKLDRPQAHLLNVTKVHKELEGALCYKPVAPSPKPTYRMVKKPWAPVLRKSPLAKINVTKCTSKVKMPSNIKEPVPVSHVKICKQVNMLKNFPHRKRHPSVVSTKVQKHRCGNMVGSPCRKPSENSICMAKPDATSPQTLSLYSSIKLLEEFAHIKRRYKQIQIQKHKYKEALQELGREQIQLDYILEHVHLQSLPFICKTGDH